MPINSSISISSSVGRRGKNAKNDVETVQTRLNELMNSPRISLEVDGLIGPKTIGMIRDFQKSVCGFRWPDGLVDPAAKTIIALNDPASEGIWGRMSIPSGGGGGSGGGSGGGGGGGSGDTPASGVDAVEAALEALAAATVMSVAEKNTMREILTELWKIKRGTYAVYGATDISEEDLDDFIEISKWTFQISRVVIVSAAGPLLPALGSAAVVLSALGVVLLTYGMVKALLHALSANQRVYGFISTSYAMVFWAHQRRLPDRSLKALERMKADGMDVVRQWPDLDAAWREGKRQGNEAMQRGVAAVAAKAGLTQSQVTKVLKLILSTRSEDQLCRQFLSQLATQCEANGEPYVGIALEGMSKTWKYGS